VKWLIDEMLPPATAAGLNRLGHEASSVNDVGLAGASDDSVYDYAVSEGRVVVTENFADFARIVEQRHALEGPCVPVVFVRKRDFPRRGAPAVHLAQHLNGWAVSHPDPYPGVHGP
jgi:predicted nuclease of predicted toxin-antitoxin system